MKLVSKIAEPPESLSRKFGMDLPRTPERNLHDHAFCRSRDLLATGRAQKDRRRKKGLP